MTQHRGREPDRRQYVRMEPKGTVTLRVLGNVHRGRLVNIAVGGMYVATQITVPDRVLGRVIDLELRFDGPLGAWQRLSGRVTRIDADGIAIVFDAPRTPALLRMIDDVAAASDASARVISVVVIDADATRRAAIATGFHATGCQVIEAATALEAIVRLGEAQFEPDVIAVANPQAGTVDEMRAFIEREHPSSMLLTISQELLAPVMLDLPAHIRSLLCAPRGDRRP